MTHYLIDYESIQPSELEGWIENDTRLGELAAADPQARQGERV